MITASTTTTSLNQPQNRAPTGHSILTPRPSIALVQQDGVLLTSYQYAVLSRFHKVPNPSRHGLHFPIIIRRQWVFQALILHPCIHRLVRMLVRQQELIRASEQTFLEDMVDGALCCPHESCKIRLFLLLSKDHTVVNQDLDILAFGFGLEYQQETVIS